MFIRTPATAAADSLNVRRLSAAAVLGVALFAASACASSTAAAQPTATKSAANPSAAPAADAKTAPAAYPAGTALIADGSATVKVGGDTVHFPTTVTDPSWSPDGSRIAFIDANGNVATARPDGTDLVTLTVTNPSVTRSQPVWNDAQVIFTQLSGPLHTLETVTAPTTPGGPIIEQPAYPGVDDQGDQTTNNLDPSTEDRGQSGSTGELAYEHLSATGPEVWVVDYASRENYGTKLVDGSSPAVSPDGSKFAFVDTKGDIEVYNNDVPSGSKPGAPVQVTFGDTVAPTNLVWTADGTRVAYSQAGKILSVPAVPVGHSATPVVVSATPGTVTYLDPAAPDRLAQFADTDPVALSVTASEARWTGATQYAPNQTGLNAEAAVIGSATDLSLDQSMNPAAFPGPVLLTGGTTLDPKVSAELRRLFGSVDPSADSIGRPTVYLLGGTSQISTSISNAIARMGYQVQRVTKPFTAQAGTQDYRANRNVSFVAVDQANPLDDLIGTDFAQSYVTPMINVGGGSSLPTSAAGWIAQAGGWVTATALFAPAPADAALSTAISGIEAGPFGTTFVADPAKPFGEN